MFEAEVTLKKSGKKLTAEIPQDVAARERLVAGEKVRITVSRKTKPNINVIRETFGKLKFKEPTSRLMREIDRELDPEL